MDKSDTIVTPAARTDSRGVAAALGVSVRTVARLADRGVLPAERLTPRSPRRFRVRDVFELVREAT